MKRKFNPTSIIGNPIEASNFFFDKEIHIGIRLALLLMGLLSWSAVILSFLK